MKHRDKIILIIEDILALITLISLIVIAFETIPSAKEYLPLFQTIEYIVVAIFTLEYITRIMTAKNPFAYIFSFYGVVDLISVLPTLVGAGGFVYLKSLRIIRISRSLRMLRVFKFAEVADDINAREKKEREIGFFFYLQSLVIFTVIFGVLMYIVEFNHYALITLPDSLLWALTLLVGMTPVIEPTMLVGEAIKIGAMVAGFMLFGVLVYIVRNVIANKFTR